MPGILPMKVIKVGGCSNNQTRIAQACDRCRSKKIRCDGIRPSCTQCLNVGFECKTSDKLSRRAFPRGYTESLEERVRALETEVRELKDLLDEKDEKIDLLSRLHPHSSPTYSISRQFPLQSPPLPTTEGRESPVVPNDTFKVQQSPLLSEDENKDSYFVGMSSGRMLVDAFKQRVLESGRPSTDIQPDAFFHSGAKTSKASTSPAEDVTWKAPPRLASDQMINIFFQEWAPLFPVIHRPSFLESYTAYTADPEAMSDMKMVAQLNLVFGIAALSSPTRDTQEIRSIERQWHRALESCVMENSLSVLQNLVLAQIYCMLSGDYSRLLKYKGLAITLAHRLGLHQSQKRHPMGALTSETRKKAFWTLYTIDCLSAAHLGLPKLLKEDEIQCEYPVDADDDYVTEKGFLPISPGETTKLSAGLALFRVSRILARVLDQLYPSSSGNEVSFRTIGSLAEDLDAWSVDLPSHLRLHFAQDKPSTNVTGSRSPILSLAYHYTKSLIFRPAVCANLGDRSSSAVLSVAQSAKSIVQIIQLLNERGLSFSFPMNQNELLSLCGFGLLFQTISADHQGKLLKDCQRMVCIVIDLLEKGSAPFAPAFRRLGCTILTAQRREMQQPIQQPSPPHRQDSNGEMPAPPENAFRATQRHLKALASRLPGISRSERSSRPALPQTTHQPNHSTLSVTSIRSEPPSRSEPRLSPPSGRSSISNDHNRRLHALHNSNLDFLSFDHAPVPSTYSAVAHPSLTHPKQDMSPTDWERLVGNMDHGATNIYDTIYGGPQYDGIIDLPPSASEASWSPEMWNMCMAYGSGNGTQPQMTGNPGAQSVLSFSDESLTSGEEFVGDWGSVGSEQHFPGHGVFLQDLSPGGVKAEEQQHRFSV